MGRIDELPDNAFVIEVKALEIEIDNLKKYQLSGYDSVRLKRIFSASPSDLIVTGVDFDSKAFELIFTPTDSSSNTSLVYKMEYEYTEDLTASSVGIFVERQKVEPGNIQKWLFALNGSNFDPNPLVTFKFYFWASGNGTFTTQML